MTFFLKHLPAMRAAVHLRARQLRGTAVAQPVECGPRNAVRVHVNIQTEFGNKGVMGVLEFMGIWVQFTIIRFAVLHYIFFVFWAHRLDSVRFG